MTILGVRQQSNNLYVFRVWQNFRRRGRLLSDFEEIKTNPSAWNDFEENLKRRREEVRMGAADAEAAAAADAFSADDFPPPDQMFSDTDDGF